MYQQTRRPFFRTPGSFLFTLGTVIAMAAAATDTRSPNGERLVRGQAPDVAQAKGTTAPPLGGPWTQAHRGIAGGSVAGIARSAIDPDIVVIATSPGAWRSVDGGVTWARAEAGLRRGTFSLDLDALPNGDFLLVQSGFPSLYRSTDGGQSWSEESVTGLSTVSQVAIDPTDTDRLLASNGFQVAESLDGGQTWSAVGTISGASILEALEIGDGSQAYAAAFFGGVFVSSDGGRTWAQSNTGREDFFGNPVTSGEGLAVDPRDPLVVYSTDCSSGGVFKSIDGGLTWSESRLGCASGIGIDPANPDRLFVQDQISTNGGASWATSGLECLLANAIADFDLTPGQDLLAGGSACGVLRSTTGTSWSQSNTGFELPWTERLSVVGSQVFAGTIDAGVNQSADGGQSWTRVTDLPVFGHWRHVTPAPSDPTVVYAARSSSPFCSGVQKSIDGGLTFTDANTGIESFCTRALGVAATDANRAVIAGTGGAVAVTMDGGTSWSTFSIGGSGFVNALAIDPVDPDLIFVARSSPNSISRSTNGGMSFAPLTFPASSSINVLTFDPAAPTPRLLAGTSADGLYESTDGGDNWTSVPGASSAIEDIAFDSLEPGHMATAGFTGVLFSRDSGASWRVVGTDAAIGTDSAVAFDPLRPGRILVGTTSGIYGNFFDVSRLVATGTDTGDRFGQTVVAVGNQLFVGVPGDDDAGADAGAVFIFRREGADYVFEEKVMAPPEFVTDGLGASLAASGDLLVVGAPGGAGGAKGLGSIQAAIFQRLQQGWQFKAPIGSQGSAGNAFGAAVAVDGTTVVIGAPEDDMAGSNSGAAFVFDVEGDAAVFREPVAPMTAQPGARFGAAVAATGGKLGVGAPGPVGGALAGTVTLFDQISTNVNPAGQVTSGGTGEDGFGTAIAIDGNNLAIGAPAEEGGQGAVYLFDFSARQMLGRNSPDDLTAGAGYGSSVALADNRLAAGAPNDGPGSVVLLEAAAGLALIERLRGADDTVEFGRSVTLSDHGVVVGAPGSDSLRGEVSAVEEGEVLFRADFEL